MAFGYYDDDEREAMEFATNLAAQDAMGYQSIVDSIVGDDGFDDEPCACEFGGDMCGYCEDRHMAAWYRAETEADALAIIA